MDDLEGSTSPEQATRAAGDGELPPGDHPLEVAARKGFGPLSSAGGEVWHGNAVPCVSCGQLVRRDQEECDECGQDLSPVMIDKMRDVAGPWFVLEHVRPFPGVNLDRIVRQIRRGVLTATSIVRGPASDFQWRFAVETPGLCRYFGRCWKCCAEVPPTDTVCRNCHTYLSFEPPRPKSAAARSGAPDQLRELSAAVDQAEAITPEPNWDDPPRIAGIPAVWVAIGLIIVVVAALMWIVHLRSKDAGASPAPVSSAIVQPLDPEEA